MKLKCKNRIFLAPMEEVNDVAFRQLCLKSGAGLTWTGLIHPLNPQEVYLDDKPVLQLFCTSTKGIKEFMKKYDSKVSGWDFNLGCPAKTARKHGFGSFLKDLEVIENILKTMRACTKKLLCVKIRKSKIAFKVLKIAEKYCDVICIHPRTQSQGYSGFADLNYAKEFKKKSKIPVIYSGDVNEKNALELLKVFDYVMIGRAAIGNPNVFSESIGKEKTFFTFADYLKLVRKFNFPFRQLKAQAMYFTKGLENAKELRLKIFKIRDKKELGEFVERMF